MRFVQFEEAAAVIRGKSVAIVGSAPSCLDNRAGAIDGHEIVVRVNNHKTGPAQGFRTDVFYSFFGGSIRKEAAELQAEGVKLCICKCPDGKPIESAWHEQHNKQSGIDFRYIYRNRLDWWFCDTYIPDNKRFVEKFELLGRHIPTTGFSAILDVLACEPRSVYLTGFDFFRSGCHNVDEVWRPGNPGDPIGHQPEMEAEWLAENLGKYPITLDRQLQAILTGR